jgi:hypothetical protein
MCIYKYIYIYIWQCLFSIRHNEYAILGYHHIFSLETLIVDVFVACFEVWDHYCDVGHHVLVQDAPSFFQKSVSLIHVQSLFCFSFKSVSCPIFVNLCIDFHGLALPGCSRAHHDVRLEKSIPAALISSSVIKFDAIDFVFG